MTWTLCHIPRTAGTSLKEAYPAVIHQHDPHATAWQLRAAGVQGSIFAVLRDPFQRALSLYRVQTSPDDSPQGFVSWLRSAAHGKALANHSLPNGLPNWAPQARYVLDAAGTVCVDRLLLWEDVVTWGLLSLGDPMLPGIEPGGVPHRQRGVSDREGMYRQWPGAVGLCREVYWRDYELRSQHAAYSGQADDGQRNERCPAALSGSGLD